jgi:hypothetical protein
VKSIRMGNQDVLEDGLDLTRGVPESIEIAVSGKPGAVEGMVAGAKGAAAAGITVALVPQDAKRRQWAAWYGSATTDLHGKFSMAGLHPGEYKLFAWDDVEDTAWMDPEYLKPQESKGTLVKVVEGGLEKVELKVILGQ